MNWAHRRICASARWRQRLETEILPWVLSGVDLGRDVLEVGPGPGLTTDLLRTRVERLTSVEVERGPAESLAKRMAGTNVTVLHEDATRMPLADGAFDSALSFTMLHHVPSAALQDQLLREVARVLKPGGVFAGLDSCYSLSFGMLHWFDTMVVVDPKTFPARLEAAGFADIRVDVKPKAFRFRARRAGTG